MYEIKKSHGLDFIVRANSVDLENLQWMSDSIFLDELFKSRMTEKDCIVDLGAHIGSFALTGVGRTGCRAVCFEPDDESYRISIANAYLNGIAHLVDFHLKAIGSSDGKAVLHQAYENWGHTILEDAGSSDSLTGIKREVAVVSLDTVMNHVPPAEILFVKFNIEGAEFQMFEGATSCALERVSAFVGEVHYDLVQDDFRPCLERLQGCGFATNLIPQGDVRAILVARKTARSKRVSAERPVDAAVAHLEMQIAKLDAARSAALAERDAAVIECDRLRAECETFRRSTSWRLTRPLRWVREQLP